MANKPRIRFRGFTEDWEQRKLDDITEVIMGQSPSSKNYTDNPNDNILVQGNADLKDGKVIPRLWTKEITKTIDKDGIILTVRAPVGDVAKTDYKVVLGRGVAGIKGNDYIYHFLQKLQNNQYWVSLSSGSTFESINSNDIKDLIIDIPSIEEQTKISILLNNVNSIITLHQHKLKKLNLAKKALLQKLFPRNGSQFPVVRFKGFTDAWEQRKLDDIVKIKTGGGTPKTTNPEYWSGDIPWIQSSDLVEGDIVHVNINKYINDRALKNSAAKLISRDSIALVTRVGVGKVAVINQDFTTSQDFLSLSNFDGNDIKFFAYQLYRLMQENAKILQGTSIKGITKTDLIEQSIVIPSSIQEQNLIANVLSKIDSIITLHQRKLEKLQEVKKGLLQKMFV